jgi:hypothetical protein
MTVIDDRSVFRAVAPRLGAFELHPGELHTLVR